MVLGWSEDGERGSHIGTNIGQLRDPDSGHFNGHFQLAESGLYQVFLHLTFRNPDPDKDGPQTFNVAIKKSNSKFPNSPPEKLLSESETKLCHVTGTRACHNVMLQGALRLRKDDQIFITTNQNDALERSNGEFGYFGIVFISKD